MVVRRSRDHEAGRPHRGQKVDQGLTASRPLGEGMIGQIVVVAGEAPLLLQFSGVKVQSKVRRHDEAEDQGICHGVFMATEDADPPNPNPPPDRRIGDRGSAKSYSRTRFQISNEFLNRSVDHNIPSTPILLSVKGKLKGKVLEPLKKSSDMFSIKGLSKTYPVISRSRWLFG